MNRTIITPGKSPAEIPIVDLTLADRKIYARLEQQTASGSHKDYAGQFLIDSLRRQGRIGGRRRERLIVPSSGNFGHSIATHTRDSNVEVQIVTDVLSPKKLIARFRDYDHVEVKVINSPDETGSHVRARLEWINALLHDDPRLIYVDQYSDPRIPLGYEYLLLPELMHQMHEIAAVFVAVGTGGLANATYHFRERFGLNFLIFAVDADGSCLARPPRHGARRRLSGYGNGRDTRLAAQVKPDLDRWIFVDDEAAVEMCHRIRDTYGLDLGPSSGAVLSAFEQLATWRSHVLPSSGNIVAILPDGGGPYAETVYNPAWLRRNGLGQFLTRPVFKGIAEG